MRLDVALQAAAINLAEADKRIADTLYSLRDAMLGQPAAQRFEPIRSVRTVLWCWEHEREIDHREGCQGAKDGEYCTGETIAVQDPTGEAAVSIDKARIRHRELSKLITQVLTASHRILDIEAENAPVKAVSDRAGIGTCDSCRHYCTGEKDDRLRPVGEYRMCNRCRMRDTRDKAKAS